MWARAALAASLSILVGAIVGAPLDKCSAESLPIVAVKADPAAPFCEVGVPKYVFVVCTPPNEQHWFQADWIEPPIYEGASPWQFNTITHFGGHRGKEERGWLGGIDIIGRDRPGRPPPVNANFHTPGGSISAIFPLWQDGKTGDIKMLAGMVTFRNVGDHGLFQSQERCDFYVKSFKKDVGTLCGLERPLTRVPQFFGRKIQSPCEYANKNSCDGGKSDASPIKEFSGLKEQDKRYVISGATFLVGIWICTTIFLVRGDKRQTRK